VPKSIEKKIGLGLELEVKKVLHFLQPWGKIFDFLSEKMCFRVMAAPCLLGLG
jgi:hypothetical protein